MCHRSPGAEAFPRGNGPSPSGESFPSGEPSSGFSLSPGDFQQWRKRCGCAGGRRCAGGWNRGRSAGAEAFPRGDGPSPQRLALGLSRRTTPRRQSSPALPPDVDAPPLSRGKGESSTELDRGWEDGRSGEPAGEQRRTEERSCGGTLPANHPPAPKLPRPPPAMDAPPLSRGKEESSLDPESGREGGRLDEMTGEQRRAEERSCGDAGPPPEPSTEFSLSPVDILT